MKPRIVGALLVLTVAAVGLGPRLLSRVEFFAVRRVEVRGLRYLPPEALVEALQLAPEANLFDGTEGMSSLLLAVPGVTAARVGRRWPGTLVVAVTEAEPVALIARREGLALMDRWGRVLPFDPTRHPEPLPIAEADSAVATVLGRLKTLEPEIFQQIDRASRVRMAVALRAGDRRYLVRSDARPEALHDLGVVIRDLQLRGQGYRELDARFASRIFVREAWS